MTICAQCPVPLWRRTTKSVGGDQVSSLGSAAPCAGRASFLARAQCAFLHDADERRAPATLTLNIPHRTTRQTVAEIAHLADGKNIEDVGMDNEDASRRASMVSETSTVVEALGGGVRPKPAPISVPAPDDGGLHDKVSPKPRVRGASSHRPTTVKRSPRRFLERLGRAQQDDNKSVASQNTRRGEVSAEVMGAGKHGKPAYRKTLVEKSDGVRKMLRKAVDEGALFVGLSDQERNECVDAFEKLEARKNERLIEEGDQGNLFYVLEEGTCEAFKLIFKPELNDKVPVCVMRYETGGSFGELALLFNEPRAATVKVTSDRAVVWTIDRKTFKSIQVHFKMMRQQLYEENLRRISAMKNLTGQEIGLLLDAVEEVKFPPQTVIMKEGDTGDNMYIILEGEVKYESKKSGELGQGRKGDIFGERALAKKEKRAATVTTTTEVVCMSLSRQRLEETLGSLSDLERVERPKSVYNPAGPSDSTTGKYHIAIRFEDLDTRLGKASGGASSPTPGVETVLGVGTFGKVILVKHKQTGKTFALKRLVKNWIVENCLEQHVIDERNVMTMLDHPFILKLHNSFWDDKYVYLLLELCLGGELFTYLRKAGKFKEDHARFYTASIVEAFDHLHSRRIVYRDLKPENIMLDPDGFVKLVDFGLAKVVQGRTWTLCGTPEYLAPEIVLSKGHNKAVDYWALGVLVYELIAGFVPFQGEDNIAVFSLILENNVAFPVGITPAAKELVRGLMRTMQHSRLGNTRAGISAIRDHKWFIVGGFDWSALQMRAMTPPISPRVSGGEDVSNFELYEEEEEPDPAMEALSNSWVPPFPYEVRVSF